MCVFVSNSKKEKVEHSDTFVSGLLLTPVCIFVCRPLFVEQNWSSNWNKLLLGGSFAISNIWKSAWSEKVRKLYQHFIKLRPTDIYKTWALSENNYHMIRAADLFVSSWIPSLTYLARATAAFLLFSSVSVCSLERWHMWRVWFKSLSCFMLMEAPLLVPPCCASTLRPWSSFLTQMSMFDLCCLMVEKCSHWHVKLFRSPAKLWQRFRDRLLELLEALSFFFLNLMP